MENWKIIEAKCDEKNLMKLKSINNKYLIDFLAKYIKLSGSGFCFYL